MYDGDQVRVVVQVSQLGLDVAKVDVDRYCGELEGGEHALEVLRAVEQLQPDVVARAHADIGQDVREPVGTVVELPVRQPAGRRDDRLPVRRSVDDELEQVGEIEATHRANI